MFGVLEGPTWDKISLQIWMNLKSETYVDIMSKKIVCLPKLLT